MLKITVIGTGYVGLSIAILLSQKNEVIAVDLIKEKVDLINRKISPIIDLEIQKYLNSENLNLEAKLVDDESFKNRDLFIIATPTNYDSETNYFNTQSVDSTIEKISVLNNSSLIIIKSTVPVGYTRKMREKYPQHKIIFSPEFLREGKALYDNLYPSRIVVGDLSDEAKLFANLMLDAALSKNVKVLFTNPTEAEAIKLFSNTFLALRVAFFNELDTYAEIKGLSSLQIIEGVGLDPRIGLHYNNPSFGYGGYCLPKDTKQLLTEYSGVPQSIIKAIVESNFTRKKYIADTIMSLNPKIIGIYRLIMKSDSDNYRDSSIIGVIELLKGNNYEIIIYEPVISGGSFMGCKIETDLDILIKKSDIIIANRLTSELNHVKSKVYTRDLFSRD